MKKTLLVILTLGFMLSFAFAKEMQPATNLKEMPVLMEDKVPVDPSTVYPVVQTRTAPEYTFTKLPTA
ncbi:MAG TPA: hypothetical protein PLL58_03060, partial [Candidatus Syntrophosphaera sp.]|nr:hypothetical protein [Candidatus Syntrophosphaera sp.]